MTDGVPASRQPSLEQGRDIAAVRTGVAKVPPAQVPGVTGLLGLAVAVVVIAALYFAQDVLVPVTLAVLLSFVLSPIVNLLRRIGLWKAPSVIVSVMMALGLVGMVGTIVGTQAASLSPDAPRYAQTIQHKVENVKAFALARAAFLTQQLGPGGRDEGRAAATASTAAERAARAPLANAARPVTVRVADADPSPFKLAATILAPVLAPLETFIIVVVVAIFILLQKEDLRDRFIRIFGSTDLHRTTLAIDEAGSRLSRYFLSQLAVNACFGLVIGIGLWAIGLPVPALWGILAGLLRFVPYIGALLGAALPLALGAAVDPGWTMVIYVAVLFALVEPLTGYVVEPLLYGHSTGLSPVSVVLAAVFWTWIWGPVGLVLAMPLTLCLVVLGRHVKSLEFLDVLLGDRAALTPVESFYQRMLADDSVEALEQAELLLKDRPLASYYDDVALNGLKLAAEDSRRGVVDRAKAEQMVVALTSVIDDLADHDDVATSRPAPVRGFSPIEQDAPAIVADAPPPDHGFAPQGWRPAGTIACIAGRGPLDEAVSAMLAQLLDRQGFGTQRIKHAAVARDAIASLDLSAARIICLSYLEIGGTPSHLRFMVKRLRARAPQAKILVGLWPQGEAVLSDAEIQRMLGADFYAGSLREAVEDCHKVAAQRQAA